MASTESPPAIRPLTAADLDAALQLSASANWNQNGDDWRMMLTLGQGWGIDGVDDDGRNVLAASTVVLLYGADFAWTSMVLVLPAFPKHYDFTLLPLLTPLAPALGLKGPLSAERVLPITTNYLVAFFDYYLKGTGAVALAGYPEVSFEQR